MSIYDKSSLVLIPSGTKTGKVFSQKPVSGDGDFTFTRSSAATRVNADGNIEKETQNLLTYSNDFNNAVWSHSAITLTGSQAGYDGTNNAWELNKAAAAYVALFQAISNSNVVTGSFYVKAGTLTTAALYSSTTTTPNAFAHFDLTNGALLSSAGIVSASSEDVGNGWWRLSMVVSKGITNFRIYPDWSGSTAGTIYIQDAQLEQGLVARDYIETTTAAVYGGITDNTPRLDYTDSSCPALLLEPQRTNEFAHSEYLGESSNQIYNVSISANAAVSPEGVQNAYSLVSTAGLNEHFLGMYWYSAISGGTETFSVYAKANGYDWLYLRTNTGSWVTAHANFNLATGEKGLLGSGFDSSSIVDMGNGWYRCSVTYSNRAVSARLQITSRPSEGAGSGFNPDGVSGAYIYGAQLEEASYATSYIPTYGSSVSRVVETNSVTGVSDLIGQTEGTLFAEVDLNMKPESGSPIVSLVTLNNNVNNLQNAIILGVERQSGGTNRFYPFVQVGNSTTAFIAGSSLTNGVYKAAFAYKENDFVLYVNGVQIGTDNTGAVPTTSQVLLGERYTTDTFKIADGIKQALVFKTRLSNEELAALTTI